MITVFAPVMGLTLGRTLIKLVGMQITEADSVPKAAPDTCQFGRRAG